MLRLVFFAFVMWSPANQQGSPLQEPSNDSSLVVSMCFYIRCTGSSLCVIAASTLAHSPASLHCRSIRTDLCCNHVPSSAELSSCTQYVHLEAAGGVRLYGPSLRRPTAVAEWLAGIQGPHEPPGTGQAEEISRAGHLEGVHPTGSLLLHT